MVKKILQFKILASFLLFLLFQVRAASLSVAFLLLWIIYFLLFIMLWLYSAANFFTHHDYHSVRKYVLMLQYPFFCLMFLASWLTGRFLSISPPKLFQRGLYMEEFPRRQLSLRLYLLHAERKLLLLHHQRT